MTIHAVALVPSFIAVLSAGVAHANAPVPMAPTAMPPQASYAVYPPPPAPSLPLPPTIQRSGFVIGFSIGAGSMRFDCADCTSKSGTTFQIHAGGMLTPTIALLFDGSGITHRADSGASITTSITAAALQFFPTGPLWLKAGLGRAHVAAEKGANRHSANGAAVLLAIGVELMQRQTFAMDLQFRASSAAFADDRVSSGSLQLGFNWY